MCNIADYQQNVCWKCWRGNSRSSRTSLFKFSLNLTRLPKMKWLVNIIKFKSSCLRHTWRPAQHGASGRRSRSAQFAPSASLRVTPQTNTTSLHVVDIPKGSFHLIIKHSPCSLCTYQHAGWKVLDVHNSRPVCGCNYGDMKLFLFVFAAFSFEPRPKTLAAKFSRANIFFFP